MNKKKTVFAAGLCVICAVMVFLTIHLSKYNIYNSDSAIADKKDSYTAENFYLSPAENNMWNFNIGKLSGAVTINSFTVNEKNRKLSFKSTINVAEGSIKLVLVDANAQDVITTICEGTGSHSLLDYPLPPGKYIIKAVGKKVKADGDYTLVIS